MTTDNTNVIRNEWAVMDEAALFEKYGSSMQGLSSEKAQELLAKYGPNALEKASRDSVLKIFAMQFTSPVVILLLVAAIACLVVLGEIKEFAIIMFIVIFNACLATYQEKSAGDALEKLAEMNASKCQVYRDGKIVDLDATGLVPGDIIELKTGDGVPADCRCLACFELHALEALLTGESEEILKYKDADDGKENFSKNMCYMGSSVTGGRGVGIITTTGMATQIGNIAHSLNSAKKDSLTPLQHALNRLGGFIGALSISVLIIIIIVAVLTDYEDPANPDEQGLIAIIKVSVGFAVSSVPEGLPMVVTICLALGCRDMVRRKALVVSLPSVETLGSCSVICSDKTGTLTEGKMTAMRVFTFVRSPTEVPVQDFRFYPTKGFIPNGGLFKSKDLTDDTKATMDEMYVSSANSFGGGNFPNYGSLAYNHGDAKNADWQSTAARCLIASMYVNSHATKLDFAARKGNEEYDKWEPRGNMSEAAIVVAAAKMGMGLNQDTTMTDHAGIPELEVPFSSERKMAMTVHKVPTPGQVCGVKFPKGYEGAQYFAVIKGAPDRIHKLMPFVLSTDGSSVMMASARRSAPDERNIETCNGSLADQALRVLGVGICPMTDSDMSEMKSKANANERLDLLMTMQTSYFLGLLGNADPPRPGVADAIKTCQKAGVRVVMITGDQKPTACAIAKQIRLLRESDNVDEKVLVCSELRDSKNELKGDEEIDKICAQINVFSRAQPEDKIAIVHSLQRMQHVCAMTGDGVNDAPALKAADIGVAMGIAGTDVAKGAADMVLLDDNFVTIVAAVEEGRKIYANIQKFVSFLLGTNIGEVVYLSVSILATLPVPLEALQIIFLNLMSDGCPAVALAKEPADPENMNVKPRSKKANIMTPHWWIYGNLPHVFFEALFVTISLVLNLYLMTGKVQRTDIVDLCVNTYDDNGKGALPLTCVCHRWQFSKSDWATIVDWYIPKSAVNEAGRNFGYFKGKDSAKLYPGKLTNQEAFDLWRGTGTALPGRDWNGNGVDWTQGATSWTDLRTKAYQGANSKMAVSQAMRNEMKDYQDDESYGEDSCAGYGINLGRSICFLTAVYCEMMRAYTVRCAPGAGVRPPWAWECFNRNGWMHIACSISFWMTILFISLPGLQDVLNLSRPPFAAYFIGIGFPVLNAFFDEMTAKPAYLALVVKPMEAARKQEEAELEARAQQNKQEDVKKDLVFEMSSGEAAPMPKAPEKPTMCEI
jgi:magnesium-transporting ATPase (P-type)